MAKIHPSVPSLHLHPPSVREGMRQSKTTSGLRWCRSSISRPRSEEDSWCDRVKHVMRTAQSSATVNDKTTPTHQPTTTAHRSSETCTAWCGTSKSTGSGPCAPHCLPAGAPRLGFRCRPGPSCSSAARPPARAPWERTGTRCRRARALAAEWTPASLEGKGRCADEVMAVVGRILATAAETLHKQRQSCQQLT